MNNFFTRRYHFKELSFLKMMKTENEPLVQMISIESLLITDITVVNDCIIMKITLFSDLVKKGLNI